MGKRREELANNLLDLAPGLVVLGGHQGVNGLLNVVAEEVAVGEKGLVKEKVDVTVGLLQAELDHLGPWERN